MIELFKIGDHSFTILNIILVVISLACGYLGLWLINKKLDPYLRKREWNFSIKEKTLDKLLRQIVIITTVLFVIGAIGIGNEKFSLSNFLSVPLIDTKKFSLSLGNLFFLVVLFFFTRLILNIFKIVLFRATKDKDWVDEGRRFTINQLTRYFIYVIAVLLAIRSLGFEISSILIASSTLLIGLGLGLKEMFTDVVSGFILLVDGSVKVGDIVEFGEMIAKVEKINIRTSYVKTMDGKIIVLPNSKLTEENVINWTISDKVTRFNIKVGVAYGSDTEKVKNLLYQCAMDHPLVDKRRNIVIMFSDFGESALVFDLYFWAARTWEIMIIKSDLRFAIDKAFRENEIKIPFPQRDLHIVSDERSEANKLQNQ